LQNANAVAITGGTINGTTIGGATPAAGTFTTLTATGQTSLGGAAGAETVRVNTGTNTGKYTLLSSDTASNTQLVGGVGGTGLVVFSSGTNSTRLRTNGAAGNDQLLVAHTASAVNYVQVTGAATGGSPTISATGSDSSVGLTFNVKNVLPFSFTAAGGTHLQITPVFTTGAVTNQFNITGGPTGNTPLLSAQGGDLNVPITLRAKGTGAINLAPGSSGVNISNGGTVTAITRTAAGTFYTSLPTLTISPPTTAGGVQATATPQMAGQTVTVQAAGTGYVVGNTLTVVGGTFSVAAQLRVDAIDGGGGVTAASFVNTAGAYSVLPTNPASVTGGAGSGATFNITQYFFASQGPIITNAGSGYVEQPTVTFSGGGGSGAAAYASVGSSTIIRSLGEAGVASIDFHTPASASNNVPALRIRNVNTNTSSNSGFLMLQNNNGYGQIIAQGPTNAGIAIGANGDGVVRINTGGGSEINQFRVTHTASAVNYVQVTGAATGSATRISTQGSDANVGMDLVLKGTPFGPGFRVQNQGGTGTCFSVVVSTASVANHPRANPSAAGNPVSFSAEGSDTNIDLALTPKGTGNVRFGTYTADMTLIVQGFIEVKDSGGTIRKLAVIA
jgi:hypothetical protein